MKPKHQCHLSQWREWVYGAQSWKEMRLLCESMFATIGEWTLILKNGGEKKLFPWTEALMSFIPMRKISLWCPILKRKNIYMWICACLNWHMNFNSKKWLKEKLFLWNQSLNIIYPISRMSLWPPIMKKSRLLCESIFVLIDRWLWF